MYLIHKILNKFQWHENARFEIVSFREINFAMQKNIFFKTHEFLINSKYPHAAKNDKFSLHKNVIWLFFMF